MATSSTDRKSPSESDPSSCPSLSPPREYRRHRNHLFPLDDYRAATAVCGDVRAYCGLVATVPRIDPEEIEEASDSGPDDCVTCVDVWLGRSWVRL